MRAAVAATSRRVRRSSLCDILSTRPHSSLSPSPGHNPLQAAPRCALAQPSLAARRAPAAAAALGARLATTAAAPAALAHRRPARRAPAPPAAEAGGAALVPAPEEGKFLGITKATWLKIVPLGEWWW